MRSINRHYIQAAVILLFTAALVISIYLNAYGGNKSKEYGVFLGVTGEDMEKLEGYHTLVVDPSAFSREQILELKENGRVIYGYINIGSLEEYRPYYKEYESITMGEYQNWEDEKWVNTSDKGWQEFMVKKVGREYSGLGIDGFFVDNCDVYYNYQDENIYEGLCNILKGLMEYGLPVIINGGDAFVLRCIKEKEFQDLFTGVNQECVFTAIDFENKSYSTQDAEVTDYYKKYLCQVKSCGLSVYLTEYHANKRLYKKINSYCRDMGFYWYNAKDLQLE